MLIISCILHICNVLQESFELTKRQNSTQISELQSTVTEYQNHEKKLLDYIRQLEQKNDDLERSHRFVNIVVICRNV